jgi:hypothetical protein
MMSGSEARTEPQAYNDRAYLEGVAALVWRWREEAQATEAALGGEEIASVLRSCADELAGSLPASLVAAGKDEAR